MKQTLLMAMLATALLSVSAGTVADDKPMNLRKTAEAIRAGQVNAGKGYNLAEEGRFHQIHVETIGIKCGGCHTNDSYPGSYLFLRKAEFPQVVNGEKLKAVERAKCIGCHSEGNVATAFYNLK